MLQEAGDKLADPSWRKRPAHFVSFGPGSDNTDIATPGQSPRGPSDGALMPDLDKRARTNFRFGVPGSHFLSFEGPGGDAVAQGELFM